MAAAGGDINGEKAGDESVDNDGNFDHNNENSWHVQVFSFNRSSNKWLQLGSDIDGEANSDMSGWSTSLSVDGHTVTIGACHNDNISDENDNAGHLGGDINRESCGDHSGVHVSLSGDGTIV
eukprot:4819271-Ditylum_brightwellii.AAC.1